MAIKGLQITATLDDKKADEICNYIWSLNFKKDIMVDIRVDMHATDMQAKVTRKRYFICLSPETPFEKIKLFLLNKGYIED